jgi:hypothetical protein
MVLEQSISNEHKFSSLSTCQGEVWADAHGPGLASRASPAVPNTWQQPSPYAICPLDLKERTYTTGVDLCITGRIRYSQDVPLFSTTATHPLFLA